MNEKLLLKILNYQKDGIIILDENLKVKFINEFGKKILSLEENPEGKNFYEILKDNYLETVISYALQKIDEKNEILIKNEEISLNDNVYLLNIFFIERNIVIKLSDVTPYEVYKQAKRDFVSNVSHELKTPIAVLQGVLETIQNENDLTQIRNFTKIAYKRIQQMNNLINDLLTLAKLEIKEEKINKKIIKIRSTVNNIFNDLKSTAKEKNIMMYNKIEPDFKLFVDEEKFYILLKNLIENAVKYNKENGTVEVKSFEDKNYSYITVKDTGIGIPKESLPLIFERFYRVDKSRSRDVGGTGLGLSIVKHIAEAHEGKAMVKSDLGKGSEFIIKIPKN
ncbi:MAG: GHKL domain-containing protein [Aquificae bacterium]|nr:GHKL domain-containing protein [Aquificota bacterium]